MKGIVIYGVIFLINLITACGSVPEVTFREGDSLFVQKDKEEFVRIYQRFRKPMERKEGADSYEILPIAFLDKEFLNKNIYSFIGTYVGEVNTGDLRAKLNGDLILFKPAWRPTMKVDSPKGFIPEEKFCVEPVYITTAKYIRQQSHLISD